jgi:GNAT superfamily N-acetyltransferase
VQLVRCKLVWMERDDIGVSDILEDTSPDALAHAVEASVVAFYSHFGRMPGARLEAGPELTWVMTGIPAPHFNAVLRTQLASSLADAERNAHIAAMLDRFRSRGLPALWWVMPSTVPASLGDVLLAHGLTSAGTRPGMAMELAALPDTASEDGTAAPGLEIETVTDVPTYECWVEVFAACYGYSPEVVTAYRALTAQAELGPAQPPQPVRHYLGRLEGEPVAIATLLLDAGTAGLYHVGTLPAARRRGIGAAIALAPLLDARRLGYRVGVLFSSPMGVNIYRRLGFQTVCQLDRYAWQAP